MKMNRRNHLLSNRQKQAGMTLVELLVAGLISLIAALGMVMVMANTLGTGSQTIQMVRLTEEMRTAMQILSRELRRANYHNTYLSCWGAADCLSTLGLTSKVGAINVTDNGDSDCIWFWYDRPQTGTQVVITSEPVAAFRRAANADSVGILQMTTTTVGDPTCGAAFDDAQWVDITDPNVIDVMTFNVNNAASFVEQFNASGDSQRVEKIALSMTAKLKADGTVRSWIKTNTNASRGLTEFISVRNNTTFVAASP